jgi:hypothetical protein
MLTMHRGNGLLKGCFCLCFYIKKYGVFRCVWCIWMYLGEGNEVAK